jgi:hypothetical protein
MTIAFGFAVAIHVEDGIQFLTERDGGCLQILNAHILTVVIGCLNLQTARANKQSVKVLR